MKRTFNSLFNLILFVSIAGISCRKDQVNEPPPVEKKYQLVTTGSLFNSVTHKYEPFCWIDEQRIPMQMQGSAQAFPYGIEKVGNDLCVAGGYQGYHPETGELLLMPCYWKNGEKIDLPTGGLSFDERCGAADLKWFNGALYIIGDADFIPVIWKVKPGADTEIVGIPIDKGVTGVRKGSNLELYNNKLYFAGSLKRQENGHAVFNAGYWEVDANDNSSFHVIEDDLAYSLCFGLAISSKGIFIVGEYGNTSNKATPVIWSNHGQLSISSQLNANYQRLNESVIDNSGNLYVNVMDVQDYQPLLWRLYSGGTSHEPIKPQVPATAKGFCHNVSIIDNKIGYTYLYETSDGKKHAATIFNEKITNLDLSDSDIPSVHRTKIFSLQ